jgi:hypothetical protein
MLPGFWVVAAIFVILSDPELPHADTAPAARAIANNSVGFLRGDTTAEYTRSTLRNSPLERRNF